MVRIFFLSAATLAFSAMAAAQPAQSDGWAVTVGTGTLYSPSYEGDDDYSLKVLPNVQLRYGTRFFASVQEGAGYNIVNTKKLRAGPIARIRFSRDESGDQTFAVSGGKTDDLRGLGDVDTSVELGGFVEYELGDVKLGAGLRQAVSGHDGLVADFGARWGGVYTALGPPVIWSAGPRLRLVDDPYTSAYFGITPTQAAASGLPQYEADGGLHSYGVGATAIVPLSRDGAWSAVFLASYDKLSGDAADAPLVQLRGDEDQATFGVFISYTFQ
ncbi:MAG: MipA/OmpV family protein [Hyphomonas sp.]